MDVRPLSATTVRILRAAVAAIRPRGHGFDQAIDDDVLATVVEFFPYLPTPMRLAFPLGLEAARARARGSWCAGRRASRGCRPRRLAPISSDCTRWADPFAALVLGLRTLVLMNFYQHPQVLAVARDRLGRPRRRRSPGDAAALLEGSAP